MARMNVDTGRLATMIRRFLRISANICLRNRFIMGRVVMKLKMKTNES
jgi:hypothetical protein